MSKRPAARAPKGQALAEHIREEGRKRREHNKKYPEHAKLSARRGDHMTVVNFVDWFREWDGESGSHKIDVDLREMTEYQISLTMAAFFEIDYDEYQAEKQRMLDEIRAAQEA